MDARIAEQGVFKYVLLRVSAPGHGSRLLVRGTAGLQWHQDNLDAAKRELAPLLPRALVRPLRAHPFAWPPLAYCQHWSGGAPLSVPDTKRCHLVSSGWGCL